MVILLIKRIGGEMNDMLRLTERLNSISNTEHQHNTNDLIDGTMSLCNFIQKILNTKVGSVAIDPLMGVPSFDVSQGLINKEDKQSFLNHIEQLLLQMEIRVNKIETFLEDTSQITVIMMFNMNIETKNQNSIKLSGKLLSDNTFEVNPI